MATPAQILNLAQAGGNNHYNLGVGFDSGHTDITPGTLYGGWTDSYYFFPKPDNSAVVFRMKVTGGRTSSNTKYPRCELREMDDSNTGGNDPKAAWDGNNGTHWMRGKTTIKHTTEMKPWICFAQIHNGGSDVIRLQTEGTSASSLKLVARHTPPGGSEIVTTIQSSYTVGDVIDWKIENINGTIKVYLGGVVKYTGNGKYTGCYFKAGLYLQSSVNNVNDTEGGDTSEYAELELKDFMTWHTGYTLPVATYYEVNGGGTGGGGSEIPTSVNAGADATLITGTPFNRTAVETGTAAITSRKWTVVAAPSTPGAGIDNTQAAHRYGWGNPLVVSDEFNYGSTGSPAVPLADKWGLYQGVGHDGNGTRDAARCRVHGDRLIIEGLASGSTGGMEHKFDQQYGKWECRGRSYPTAVSNGNDYHPVLIIWPESGNWPEDGEYDFSENGKPGDTKYQAYIHFPHDADVPVQQRQFQKLGVDLTLWHNFAIEWTADYIRGFFDGEQIFETSGGANADRRNIQDMPSGHLTIQLDNFNGTNQTPAKFEIDWVRVYGNTASGPGTGGGGTARAAGPGGIPRPAAGSNVVLATGNTTSALNITQGGTAGNPRIYDGGSFTVGRIDINADYVVVQNYKIVANSQYGIYIHDRHDVTVQNNDIKGIKVSGDGDLNAITAFGNNIDILYNTAIDFVSGDPGGSHTDFIQTWISSSHSIASSNWRIVGNVATGPANPSRSSSIPSIHQWLMVESAGQGGNSGGSGIQTNWFIAENTVGDSWNQAFKFDGAKDVTITRNRFIGSSDKIFEVTGPSTNVKVFSDNSFGEGYGSVGYTVTSGAGPATPSDIAAGGGATPDPTPSPGTVGTTLSTTAALSWTPPSLGAYTLRYSVTTAQGTFYDDVVVNVVQQGETGGGTTTTSKFGKETAGASFSGSSTVKAAVSKFTCGADGKLVRGHCHAWLTAAGSTATKMCVYADNAGAPGAKLAESDLKTISSTVDTVQDYVFSGAQQKDVTNGTSYWVGLAWDDPDPSGATISLNIGRDSTVGLRQEVQSFPWPNLPDPFGTPAANSGPIAAWVETEVTTGTGTNYDPATFVGITRDAGDKSSLLLTPPTGLASGDHQLLFIGIGTASETFPNVPSGFVLAKKASFTSSSGDTYQAGVFISNSSTVTGDITLVKNGSRLGQAFRLAYRGGPGFNVDSAQLVQTASGSNIAIPSLSALIDEVVVAGAINDTADALEAISFTPPGGWTERVDNQANGGYPEFVGMAVWDTTPTSDGTVSGTATFSRSDDCGVFSIKMGRTVTSGGGGTGGTPGTPPEFVGVVSSKSGSSSSMTIDGSGASSGQVDVITILSAGGESMTSVPAGWELMDTIQGSGPSGAPGGPYTGWVYYNTTGQSSAATFVKSGNRFWHAVRAVWRGQNSLGAHQVRAEASGSGGTSHTTPPVSVINPNSRVVGICMQDLQNTDPGPYQAPPGWNERYDVTKSAVDEREAIAIADIVTAAPGQISSSFVGSASDEAILFAFVLEAPPPTGGGGTSGTKLEAAQAILARLSQPLAAGDFAEDWSYTGMPAVVGEWNDSLLADYVAATGPYAFPDDIDSGQVQAWLQQFIEANTPGGGGDPGPIGSPTVSAGPDATVAINTDFFRVATAEDNGAAITSQAWTIVSGPAQEGATMSTTSTVTWQFSKPGVYVIAYRATNSFGTAVDTAVITVTTAGVGQQAWRRTNGWFTLVP